MNDEQLLIKEFANTTYRNSDGSLKPFDEVLKLLTEKPLVPNPKPAPQVPAPVDKAEVLSLVPQASIQAADYEALLAFGRAADANDHQTLSLQLQVWLMKGWLTPDVAAKLKPVLERTIPDPNWPKQVPGPSRLEQVLGKTSVPLEVIRRAYDAA